MGIAIESLRGGINETDPLSKIADDQCLEAMNVEFYLSPVGERRLGCRPIDLTGSGIPNEALINHISEWFPTNSMREPEYWAMGFTPNTSSTLSRFASGAWSDVTPGPTADDALPTDGDEVYAVFAQALNGKLFFAYPNTADRLHVWDGTDLRRTGLVPPAAAPTAADTGVGTLDHVRYYRVRFIAMSGSTIVRRSEPSDVLTFTPSGTGAGIVVTRPATVGEGETHWELEASSDGAFYFLLATTAIATTTYTDTTDLLATAYSTVGPASEAIGDYLVQQNARYIIADANRLVLAGHFTDNARKCRVTWSPVYADPGVGNDERQPLASGGDNYYDLDNFDGGEITGMSEVMAGAFYVFKWSAIYRFLRTNDVDHAYDVLPITKVRGAIPGSIVNGVDEAGRPCIYFLDPNVGPCSFGGAGLREHRGLRKTWRRVRVPGGSTRVLTFGVFYAEKSQVHWWVEVDTHLSPSLKIILQTDCIRTGADGKADGGFSLADSLIATATAAGIWHETTIEDSIPGFSQVEKVRARPFVGLGANNVTGANMIQRADVADDDYNSDNPYTARIVTKPYMLTGTSDEWGATRVSMLGEASESAVLKVQLYRDFLLDRPVREVDFVAGNGEEHVFRDLDDLVTSEAHAVQLVLTDP